MSGHLRPEPSCSKEQSQSPRSMYGKCVRSSRILNRNTHNTFCMQCFAHADITTDSYELVVTHHLTNGLQDQYICANCNKRLCHARPTLECSMCSKKFTELYTKFRERGIDLTQSFFRVDLFSDTIAGPILKINEHNVPE